MIEQNEDEVKSVDFVDDSLIEARIITHGAIWMVYRYWAIAILALLNILLGTLKLDANASRGTEVYHYYEVVANYVAGFILKPALSFSLWWQWSRPN